MEVAFSFCDREDAEQILEEFFPENSIHSDDYTEISIEIGKHDLEDIDAYVVLFILRNETELDETWSSFYYDDTLTIYVSSIQSRNICIAIETDQEIGSTDIDSYQQRLQAIISDICFAKTCEGGYDVQTINLYDSIADGLISETHSLLGCDEDLNSANQTIEFLSKVFLKMDVFMAYNRFSSFTQENPMEDNIIWENKEFGNFLLKKVMMYEYPGLVLQNVKRKIDECQESIDRFNAMRSMRLSDGANRVLYFLSVISFFLAIVTMIDKYVTDQTFTIKPQDGLMGMLAVVVPFSLIALGFFAKYSTKIRRYIRRNVIEFTSKRSFLGKIHSFLRVRYPLVWCRNMEIDLNSLLNIQKMFVSHYSVSNIINFEDEMAKRNKELMSDYFNWNRTCNNYRDEISLSINQSFLDNRYCEDKLVLLSQYRITNLSNLLDNFIFCHEQENIGIRFILLLNILMTSSHLNLSSPEIKEAFWRVLNDAYNDLQLEFSEEHQAVELFLSSIAGGSVDQEFDIWECIMIEELSILGISVFDFYDDDDEDKLSVVENAKIIAERFRKNYSMEKAQFVVNQLFKTIFSL